MVPSENLIKRIIVLMCVYIYIYIKSKSKRIDVTLNTISYPFPHASVTFMQLIGGLYM